MDIIEIKQPDPDKDFILNSESENYRIITIRVYQGRPCGCGTKNTSIFIEKDNKEALSLLNKLLNVED